MRIAVVTDTHDRLPESVCAAIRGADEIWHLGDVCSPVILVMLERIAPVRVVRGNCDSESEWPLTLDFTLGGIRFHLEHIGVRFLNPGCITRPNRGAPASYAWLTLDDGEIMWKIMPVQGP